MILRFLSTCILAATCIIRLDAADVELRRKGLFGAHLAELSDDARKEAKLESGGVLLKRVIPDSAAEGAGFKAGDIVLRLSGTDVADIASFLKLLANRKGGDQLTVNFLRDGEPNETQVRLKNMPHEKGDGYEVLYRSVTNGNFRQRTIITRPLAQGRHPAVLCLQGGHTCFPVDAPLAKPSAFVKTAQHLARHGYVTMRIERPGCGDSEGGPLRDIDFETELAGNIQAVRALKRMDYVDPDNVLIYGFSMGGFYAPLIAQQEPVRGIAANGTTCGTFFEGVTGQRRRFLLLEGKSPAQVNREIFGHIRFWFELTVARKTIQEIRDAGSIPQAVLNQWTKESPYVAGRNEKFYHQIANLNLAETWGKIAKTPLPGSDKNAPQFPRVLTLLGEFDWHTTPAAGAEWIVQTVNEASPGHATKVIIPDSDHFSNHVESAKKSFDVLYGKQPRPTAPFNPTILGEVLKWCNATVVKANQ